jgi:negative regulator of flagellin synthesis FlgM
MSSINGLGSVSQIQQTSSVTRTTATPSTSATDKPSLSDRLELSGMSSLLASLKAGGDFRADKVASVKAQIEAGTYETDDKLDLASDRMLDDILK